MFSSTAQATDYYWDNVAGVGFGIAGGTWQVPTVTQWNTDAVSGTGNLSFGSLSSIVNNCALVYNISGGSVNVNRTICGTGTVSVTGNQGVNFNGGTTTNSTGSQTYSATQTAVSRYHGFTLTDNATLSTGSGLPDNGFPDVVELVLGELSKSKDLNQLIPIPFYL